MSGGKIGGGDKSGGRCLLFIYAGIDLGRLLAILPHQLLERKYHEIMDFVVCISVVHAVVTQAGVGFN